MSVSLRLSRGGSKKRPYYKIVIANSRAPRDGAFLEQVGTYNPLLAKDDENRVRLVEDRVKYWLGVGAQPSDTVISLFKRSGDWQKFSGEASPEGITPQAEKVDRLAVFNAALAEADGDPTTEAISRRGRKTEAPAQDAPAAEAVQASEETPAEEA